MNQQRIEREERILLSLKKLDFLTTKQLQQIHDLKSYRNAHRVIKQMSNYVTSFFHGQNIYYLNKNGRERVDCEKIRKKTNNVNHYLMRNDLYIHYGYPRSWRNEIKIKYESSKNKIIVVCDAHFTKDSKHYLVEIDNTQTMKKNQLKIEKYRRLIERNAFKGMPVLIWVTTTAYRRDKLLELCEGLDAKVYLKEDLK